MQQIWFLIAKKVKNELHPRCTNLFNRKNNIHLKDISETYCNFYPKIAPSSCRGTAIVAPSENEYSNSSFTCFPSSCNMAA